MNDELTKLVKDLSKLEKEYIKNKEKIKTLPKGSIYIRKMRNQYFVYRKYRDGNKVISKYVGPLKSEKVKEVIKDCEEYKKTKVNVRTLNNKINNIVKQIDKTNKQKHDLTDFAVNVSMVDSPRPSDTAIVLLKLLEDNLIDLDTYERAIRRMYLNV